ncbi:MAG: hypothetical protein WCI72_01125 [archaeon]
MQKQNKEDIDLYGSHKQGPVPKNITILSERTRDKYGIKVPKPTMFDGMGEADEE